MVNKQKKKTVNKQNQTSLPKAGQKAYGHPSIGTYLASRYI
jgi:hypothetical protein